MRSVTADVAEVVYAGPITRITADAAGVRLNAAVLSADTDTDISHGAPIMLAWPDSAVRRLSS